MWLHVTNSPPLDRGQTARVGCGSSKTPEWYDDSCDTKDHVLCALPKTTAVLKNKTAIEMQIKRKSGRSERIRTSDPLYPKQVRYQAAPRSDLVSLAKVGLNEKP